MSEKWGFETRQVHAGTAPDPVTGARAVPIYQTTSYVFRDTAHAAALFDMQDLGYIYTRIANPTQSAFEDRVAALEGGIAALAVASGQAATVYSVLNLVQAGDHVVSSASLYGGTYNFFHHRLPNLGVTATLLDDPDDLDAWRAAIRPNTKLCFGETIGNPRGDVLDIEGVAGVAHAAGLPLIVDNTLASPWLCRPFEWDADVVIHSATKFLGGHGTSIGGVIVDGGRFDWSTDGRFPQLTRPDPSYHGFNYHEAFGPAAYIARARAVMLRDLGAAIAPQNAFYFLQGVETLSLRMERHVENAQAVAEWLVQRPDVGWVNYPGLASSPWHRRAQRYLPRGAGAVLALGIEGGLDVASGFVDSLRLFSHLVNVGDVRSLASHPASTTHRQLSSDEQLAGGITPDLVRLSIGIETLDDILDDLDQAFAAARGQTAA
ncbi:MAG TPA: bifunctional o-acetylhomoserine/o-acetylserine sulfhydrylase [Acidimicrobiales bacterium]|nr:bifunctional o-acetylhomoserine/o-acetylserine sulfhydrylase [Acidimicrobiales bacterium]